MIIRLFKKWLGFHEQGPFAIIKERRQYLRSNGFPITGPFADWCGRPNDHYLVFYSLDGRSHHRFSENVLDLSAWYRTMVGLTENYRQTMVIDRLYMWYGGPQLVEDHVFHLQYMEPKP